MSATTNPRPLRFGDRVRYVRTCVPVPEAGDPWASIGDTGTVRGVHTQRDPDAFGRTLVRVVIDGRESDGWVPFAAEELERLDDFADDNWEG